MRFFQYETILTTFMSMVINFFIIGTFTYFNSTAELIQLKDVGDYLASSFGQWAAFIWGIGLFSSGQSATIAGALTGQFLMEGFLNLRISREYRALISRGISLLPCLMIAKYLNVELTYIFLNIVQFVQLPFVLIPLFRFIEDKNITPDFELDYRVLSTIKVVSALFVLMNIGQLVSIVPAEFEYVILLIAFLLVYLLVLTKLMKAKKRSSEDAENHSLDSIELL